MSENTNEATASGIVLDEEALEAAAEAVIDASFGQELPEAPIDLARAAVMAFLENLPVEYAARHLRAGLETMDDDGEIFTSEEWFRTCFEDHANATLVSRRVTNWEVLPGPQPPNDINGK